MRVVAGKAKGSRLRGATSAAVRPTTERVRAAIFNILQPHTYEDQRVLDLYAGTGSLGIEALSRGAGWADFVEQDRRQCAVIQANLDATGFRDFSNVSCASVESVLGIAPSRHSREGGNPAGARLNGPYQLVLLDPPYRLQTLGATLDAIASTPGLVGVGGMVVAGHSKRSELRETYGTLRITSQRRYGDNAVDFYCKEA